MTEGFKIAMLNTGGPNHKPLEYGAISNEQMEVLRSRTLKPLEGLDAGKILYDFLKDKDTGKLGEKFKYTFHHISKEELINKGIIVVEEKDDTGNITTPGEIRAPTEKSRFESSVQDDTLDIYSPERLIAFINEKSENVLDAISNHLQKIVDAVGAPTGQRRYGPEETYHWDPTDTGGSVQEFNKDLEFAKHKEVETGDELNKRKQKANDFFVLGYMFSQVKHMVKISNLTSLLPIEKELLKNELRNTGNQINFKKAAIIKQMSEMSELDIVMLNECLGFTYVNPSETPKFKVINQPNRGTKKNEPTVDKRRYI